MGLSREQWLLLVGFVGEHFIQIREFPDVTVHLLLILPVTGIVQFVRWIGAALRISRLKYQHIAGGTHNLRGETRSTSDVGASFLSTIND
jgi:hypothetical protein